MNAYSSTRLVWIIELKLFGLEDEISIGSCRVWVYSLFLELSQLGFHLWSF